MNVNGMAFIGRYQPTRLQMACFFKGTIQQPLSFKPHGASPLG